MNKREVIRQCIDVVEVEALYLFERVQQGKLTAHDANVLLLSAITRKLSPSKDDTPFVESRVKK